jgi:hypothetical protein
MPAATYADLDIFHPEILKTMFMEIRPPTRLYSSIFKAPSSMGLYSFSQGSFDDPFAMLPPVEELEDAKSMFAEQEIEDYKLQEYRGFVDISNKVIRQWEGAGNMPALIKNLQERYVMVLREGFENTMEYTCFKAMDDKAVLNTGTTDWTDTVANVSADKVLKDLQYAKENLMTSKRVIGNTAIINPKAESAIITRKELANMLYNGRGQGNTEMINDGDIGRMLGLRFITQPGGFTDYEGETLSIFQPTSANKALAYILNPEQFGYPVIFGAPEFTVENNASKNSVRIYVNAAAGFVYRYPEVEKITA